MSIFATAVVSCQWFLWGYSLTFSHTAGPFIGDVQNVGFRNVLGAPSVGSSKVPDLLFAIYQGMFSTITVALACGAIAERGRLLPCVAFMFLWATLIYDPIACWTWNTSGWVNKMGGLDFAGGTPVHIASGAAALAYSQILGRRLGYNEGHLNYQAHNATHVVLGTVFLWFGWFGFNGGSALSANLRAVMAAVVTNLAACAGGITWCLIDYIKCRRWSTVGCCTGIVVGLVAITPASGFVPAWSAPIYGVVGSLAASQATRLKFWWKIDDALDIFAVHAIGGLVGNLLTGFFAANYIAHLDGTTIIKGGFLNHHWQQLGYQAADSITGGLYSYLGTLLICKALDCIPYMHLRVTAEEEAAGTDDTEIGEFAHDYIYGTRDVLDHKTGIAAMEHWANTKLKAVEEQLNEVIANQQQVGQDNASLSKKSRSPEDSPHLQNAEPSMMGHELETMSHAQFAHGRFNPSHASSQNVRCDGGRNSQDHVFSGIAHSPGDEQQDRAYNNRHARDRTYDSLNTLNTLGTHNGAGGAGGGGGGGGSGPIYHQEHHRLNQI